MKRDGQGTTCLPMRAGTFAVVAFAVLALALALAGCAPKANDNAASPKDDEAAAVQVDFSWSETSDCSMCHEKEQSSFEDTTCAASQHAGTACITCHTDASALASAHEGATAEKASKAVLKSTTVDAATCESCHALDEVAAATANVEALTDANGTVVNPHALPESTDHAEVTCTSCHQMHVSGATIEKKAQRVCASCHHADVYECYTCHN